MIKFINIPLTMVVLFFAHAAQAINCMSDDTEKLQQIYTAYVESGQLPEAKILSDKKLGSSGFTVSGSVTGVTNNEACWHENPPCDTPAEFATARLSFLSSAEELKRVYKSNAKNGLIDCFQKIGIRKSTEKKSYDKIGDWFR